jgi:two-component system nitrogen regulation sensor histidine kinase GlnL
LAAIGVSFKWSCRLITGKKLAKERKSVLKKQTRQHTCDVTPLNNYQGLDLIATAVMVVDEKPRLIHANASAENLFAFSRKNAIGTPLARVIHDNKQDGGVFAMLGQVLMSESGFSESSLTIVTAAGQTLHCSCVATPIEADRVVLEFQPLDQHLKIAREEKLLEQQKLNRELIRNLAHEIKNPLGGIRGAAQLLERELPDDTFSEYTQVIVKEADRLRSLMDRLLTPNRLPKIEPVNIHEVLEHVRSLVLAEFPKSLQINRDYDTSMPDLLADREQLIQAMLNIARNAAQATGGFGKIRFQTRIARQVTIVRERFRLAIEIRICDTGPGVPEHLRNTIFYPLVTGHQGGTGVGLSLAQNFVNQHAGVIEFESTPGDTQFIVTIPVRSKDQLSEVRAVA